VFDTSIMCIIVYLHYNTNTIHVLVSLAFMVDPLLVGLGAAAGVGLGLGLGRHCLLWSWPSWADARGWLASRLWPASWWHPACSWPWVGTHDRALSPWTMPPMTWVAAPARSCHLGWVAVPMLRWCVRGINMEVLVLEEYELLRLLCAC